MEVVKKEESVLKSGNPFDQNVKIAYISFVFDNCNVMKKLQTRGFLITQAQHDKVATIEQEINQMISGNFESLSRPVAAFITFET